MTQKQEISKRVKLLMITRKVDKNDALAGFAYNWVRKLGEQVDNLKVICLEKGDVSGLPNNIKVYSLGKEKGFGRWREFFNFQKLAFKLTPEVDGVFCHMNPEYTILIAPYAKLFRKKIIIWYTHKQITWKLRLASLLANKILTASKESFRINSPKTIVTGHGIDVEIFKPSKKQDEKDEMFKILSLGRISPTKDYETLIKAIDILVNGQNIKKLRVNIIGAPGLSEQKTYFEALKKMAEAMNLKQYIHFLGSVSHKNTVEHYQNSDLFINLSHTGSVDKTILEAMACGCLAITSNEAFFNILPLKFLINQNQPEKLAQKIKYIMDMPDQEKEEIGAKFREKIKQDHNLDLLVLKIVGQFT